MTPALSRFGLRARLLFGAVLPALLMVSMLGMTFLQRYQADLERSFVERSKAIAQQLGVAADVLGELEAARRELAQQKAAAEAMARSDALTGLANRRAFDEVFEQEIRRAGRYGTPLSLVMTDIDFFKAINDSHGHHVGDLVLKHFAQTLQSSVRDVDLVGRWGGEEFVVLMPDATLDAARLAAERMRLAVAGAPARCGNAHCGYTASFGVAAFSGEGTSSHDAMLSRADAALYRAKKNGRNRVETG